MNPLEMLGVATIVAAGMAALIGCCKLVSVVLEMDRHQKMCDAHFSEHCTWAHDRSRELSCRIAFLESASKQDANKNA